VFVSLAALETHFFQIVRHPKPERKGETKPVRKGHQVDKQLIALAPSSLQLGLCL
jgi:hypothetical protein